MNRSRLFSLVTVAAFCVASLSIFHMPDFLPKGSLSSSLPYFVIIGTFLYLIRRLNLPTLQYFRKPEISIPSLAGLLVATAYALMGARSGHPISLPFWSTVAGLVYLLSIGVGEELVSRGFSYGVFRKFGRTFALGFSSLFFGLMHLNLYLGKNWNAYNAYWHCLGAFGFGLLAATVMIVTKSIFIPMLMHAVSDWAVVFSKSSHGHSANKPIPFDPPWQTFKDSIAHISFEVLLTILLLFILWISRRVHTPKWFYRILLRFKLVECKNQS